MAEALFATHAPPRPPIPVRAPWSGVGPHDLLHLRRPDMLQFDAPPSAWVGLALRHVPWVVVRRAPPRDGLLPVGIRGDTRDLRCAAWVAPEDVDRVLSPHALRSRVACLSAARMSLPAARALGAVERAWATWALPWGPGGSLGFELATGWPTVGRDSDLDLVVHARNPLSRSEARRRLDALPALGARIDVQLETPAGAVALLEFARQGDGPILLRGLHGPHLVRDPWDWVAADRPR